MGYGLDRRIFHYRIYLFFFDQHILNIPQLLRLMAVSLILCSVTILVGNVDDMLDTCRHEIHVLVILDRHANSANTDHHISCVVSQFGVVV